MRCAAKKVLDMCVHKVPGRKCMLKKFPNSRSIAGNCDLPVSGFYNNTTTTTTDNPRIRHHVVHRGPHTGPCTYTLRNAIKYGQYIKQLKRFFSSCTVCTYVCMYVWSDFIQGSVQPEMGRACFLTTTQQLQ